MYLGSIVIQKCFGFSYVPKVGLLAFRSRFAYRTNIVTILLRFLFSLAFLWKKLRLCVAQSEYVYNGYVNEFTRTWVRVELGLSVEFRVEFGGRQYGYHRSFKPLPSSSCSHCFWLDVGVEFSRVWCGGPPPSTSLSEDPFWTMSRDTASALFTS